MSSNGHSCNVPEVMNIADNDNGIITVNIFENHENVEELKNRLKEIAVKETDGHTGDILLSSEGRNDIDCNDNYEAGVSNSSSSQNDVDSSDRLCLSTETLIENSDGLCVLQDVIQHYQRPQSHSGALPEDEKGLNNVSVSSSSAKMNSGLLISPNSLTQEVHVSMDNNKQRMSAVLDSLDLHLVYIPTTQQLVASKKSDTNTSKLHVTNSDSVLLRSNRTLDESETESSGYASGKSNSLERQNSGSPMKMMSCVDTCSVHSIQVLTPGGSIREDGSSLHESDCLIKINEPDGSNCDSSEYFSDLPRINTNDSLLRTFNDASSLSSISTGTDFSISAASLDDYGEGTGHCIDTGDAGFMEINLHTRNSFERKNPSQDSGFEDKCSKPKRKSLSGIFSRFVYKLI